MDQERGHDEEENNTDGNSSETKSKGYDDWQHKRYGSHQPIQRPAQSRSPPFRRSCVRTNLSAVGELRGNHRIHGDKNGVFGSSPLLATGSGGVVAMLSTRVFSSLTC